MVYSRPHCIRFRRALAVQEQQIEGEEDELVSAALVHSRLQAAEHRHTIGIERAKFTIDVGGLRLQGLKGPDCTAIPVRPVQPRARQQLGLASLNSGVHAVAVELDLMQPAVTSRRLVDDARELRLNPLGRPRRRSHCCTGAYGIELRKAPNGTPQKDHWSGLRPGPAQRRAGTVGRVNTTRGVRPDDGQR